MLTYAGFLQRTLSAFGLEKTMTGAEAAAVNAVKVLH